MNLRLVADKLEALSRPDRTVIVSGQATVVRDASRFAVEGKFKADRALIEFAPQDRPTISDDVIVLGRGRNRCRRRKGKGGAADVDLTADLGDDFHLRGLGIDAYLAGSVRVRMVGDDAPRINGSVRTASGTYAAYGQRLAIERGVVTFSGPTTTRRSTCWRCASARGRAAQRDQCRSRRAGARHGAVAEAKLVSTPNVPDSEKLSWLVLGHGMEGTTGNEADVLSAAAGALLGGKGGTGGIQSKLANSLGVDELGVRQGAPGTAGAGKHGGHGRQAHFLAPYLSFEQGAATASSLVRLRYKLTPRFTLQFQTGHEHGARRAVFLGVRFCTIRTGTRKAASCSAGVYFSHEIM
jgi:translocation and assembly module TamB